MNRPICPACGDIQPFWRDPVPAAGCLMGHASAPCPDAIARARAAAERRKFCPEAFDANGNILPDGWKKIFAKWGDRSLPEAELGRVSLDIDGNAINGN